MSRLSENIKEIKKRFRQKDKIIDCNDRIIVRTPCHCIPINKFFAEDKITNCPTCAYAIKYVAFEDMDQKVLGETNKAKAQRLWLRHCLSKETDYIFQVLKEVKDENGASVDREEDVKTIADKYLAKGAPLAKHIGSDEGVKFYKKTIADWYLRRYYREMAKEILKPFGRWDKLKLFYPRLIAAIIIGLLALMTGEEGWNLPHNLSYRISHIIYGPLAKFFGWNLPHAYNSLIGLVGLLVVVFFFYALSVLYLRYECYNIIFDTKEAGRRARKVGGQGLLVSLILSTIICIAIGPISGSKEVISPDTYCNFQAGLPIFKNIVFFASVALFIGIFIQVFWEKETITEPL